MNCDHHSTMPFGMDLAVDVAASVVLVHMIMMIPLIGVAKDCSEENLHDDYDTGNYMVDNEMIWDMVQRVHSGAFL